MRIDNQHMEKLAEMLGIPSVTWSRLGAHYSPDRVDILDNMVSVGLVRVEETVEAWGPCVTYIATDYAKSILARSILQKKKEEEMKNVHCSTEEFFEKMSSIKFVRTSLHSGVIESTEYTCTEPPELVEGFIESKINMVIELLEPKETVLSVCMGVLVWTAIFFACISPLIVFSFILR